MFNDSILLRNSKLDKKSIQGTIEPAISGMYMVGNESESKFWETGEQVGVMPSAENVIAGEVQTAQQIPLGATHFAMFPQTNAILALVLSNKTTFSEFLNRQSSCP